MLLVAVELACDRIVVEETSVWIGCVIVVVVIGVSGFAAGALPAFRVPPPGLLGHIMSRMQQRKIPKVTKVITTAMMR